MSKEPGLRLKIEQPKLWPQSTRAWLEGVEISRGLQKLTLEWDMGEPTHATLVIGLRSVEMDAQTLAHLTAIVERQREASIE